MKNENLKYWVENNNGCTCGHMHRSFEAAEKCRQKLLAWNRKEKTCSAKWYNSLIKDTWVDTRSLSERNRELEIELGLV